ncbi:hypothetical protein SAMN05216316_3162 [Nitrosovibrio sp. Nv6]|nr:hypothetical protein SAMN05216316_3162 [Nitrosovibrio sp. Nv6]
MRNNYKTWKNEGMEIQINKNMAQRIAAPDCLLIAGNLSKG